MNAIAVSPETNSKFKTRSDSIKSMSKINISTSYKDE